MLGVHGMHGMCSLSTLTLVAVSPGTRGIHGMHGMHGIQREALMGFMGCTASPRSRSWPSRLAHEGFVECMGCTGFTGFVGSMGFTGDDLSQEGFTRCAHSTFVLESEVEAVIRPTWAERNLEGRFTQEPLRIHRAWGLNPAGFTRHGRPARDSPVCSEGELRADLVRGCPSRD